MKRRTCWYLLAAIAGAALGVVVVAGGTHGYAAYSDEAAVARQSFFWVPLYDVSGPPAEVRDVVRQWGLGLNVAGIVVGALIGLAVAYLWTRRRPGRPGPVTA